MGQVEVSRYSKRSLLITLKRQLDTYALTLSLCILQLKYT